ncbi:MAG: hypothetical protein Q7U28_14500 [Aquabacterium sp.]|nr:hypothetical protein [Aquabacterium sp.]
MIHQRAEIAAAAARMVVQEAMPWGPAKRRAAKQLGLSDEGSLPDNTELEAAIFTYLSVFCADTQPAELRALRELAALWLARLADFRPHLTGAVWRGTATRQDDIHLHLYCDDGKSAEIDLLNKGIDYDVGRAPGPRGQVDCLSLSAHCTSLQQTVCLHLIILDTGDLRGALKADANGRTNQGDLAALTKLLAANMRHQPDTTT